MTDETADEGPDGPDGTGEAAGPPSSPADAPREGGDGPDRENGPAEGNGPDDEDATESFSFGNWVTILGFLALTVVGLAIATGRWLGGVTELESAATGFPVRVPGYMLVYATLGALGYVFTSLLSDLEAYDEWDDFERLAELGMRIPAAWILASGAYLLAELLVGPAGGGAVNNSTGAVPTGGEIRGSPRLLAGLAFLVGLYVNVTYKAFGRLADKLLSTQA